MNLVPALEAQYSPAQQKTEEELARWVPTIEILFALVRNTAKTGTADLAVDLGFGLAEISVWGDPAEVQEELERATVAPSAREAVEGDRTAGRRSSSIA